MRVTAAPSAYEVQLRAGQRENIDWEHDSYTLQPWDMYVRQDTTLPWKFLRVRFETRTRKPASLSYEVEFRFYVSAPIPGSDRKPKPVPQPEGLETAGVFHNV